MTNWTFDKQQFAIDARAALCSVPLSLQDWAQVIRAVGQMDRITVNTDIDLYAYAWAMLQEICETLELSPGDYISKT